MIIQRQQYVLIDALKMKIIKDDFNVEDNRDDDDGDHKVDEDNNFDDDHYDNDNDED